MKLIGAPTLSKTSTREVPHLMKAGGAVGKWLLQSSKVLCHHFQHAPESQTYDKVIDNIAGTNFKIGSRVEN